MLSSGFQVIMWKRLFLWTLLADPKSMCLAANKAQSASFGSAARQMEHEISFTG